MIKRFIFLFLLFQQTLQGEIANVTITWINEFCSEKCQTLLKRRLKTVSGVADSTITKDSVSIRWKPKEKFSFQPLNIALRYVGVRLEKVKIKVRGTIEKQGLSYYLISLGDNTRFRLLGKPKPDPNRQVFEENILQRKVSLEHKEQLDKMIQKNLVVTIEGSLFQPHRHRLDLIIDSLSAN